MMREVCDEEKNCFDFSCILLFIFYCSYVSSGAHNFFVEKKKYELTFRGRKDYDFL